MNPVKQTNRFALIYFLIFIGFGYVFYLFPFVESLSFNGQNIFAQVIYSILPILFYFLVTRKNPLTILRIHKLSWKNVVLVSLFAIVVQPFMALLSFLASLVFPNLVNEAFMSLENESLWSTLVAMAILPAILEELLVRGIFLSGYQMLGRKRAIFCSALLFGMLHMNPQQFFYAFIAGLFFCFLVERSGSIFASIIPHFIINGTNVSTYFISQSSIAETTESAIEFTNMDFFIYSLGSFMISLPFLVGVLYLFVRNNPPRLDIPKEYREKFFTVPMYLIFLLTFFYGVLPFIF
ncbi:type II CAAX endopeptidase family protein [Chakrabartyella piscis]|uniref:CPBP family intramembrane glutamic endopeptidase n=1 Tax=Chakrabartyella piscis TaxID=2918914 RepID=UPI002958C7E6|nr:type II CAAX endopeptidase family protein [Chakrabartyella piscis]